jgi:hypothetical protein
MEPGWSLRRGAVRSDGLLLVQAIEFEVFGHCLRVNQVSLFGEPERTCSQS